jgi:hypothetical protein
VIFLDVASSHSESTVARGTDFVLHVPLVLQFLVRR